MKVTFLQSKSVIRALPFVLLAASLIAAVPGPPKLSDASPAIRQAIAKRQIAGAVLLVAHRGRIVFRKSYGRRALNPRPKPMTTRTIFDLSSLTQPVATAPSVMLLVQQGKIRLDDPVARYLPAFAANGKGHITVRMLLTHFSGLRPEPDLPPGVSGASAVLRIIYGERPIFPPGMRFLYSDCNYVVLGELVHRVSGLPLNVYAERNVFRPLGMHHTRFLPPKHWISRIAPVEEIGLPGSAGRDSGRGKMLRGVAADPLARVMDGVAGNAGLFSTADDLAVFCQMMIENGQVPKGRNRGRQLLSAATIHRMTTPQSPPWSPTLWGLGWDIDSTFSSSRGELFPLGSYGDAGPTGTSMWIDPSSQTFVILLASGVQPASRPALSSLRGRVATLAAAAHAAGDASGETSGIARSLGAKRPYDLSGASTRNDQTFTGIDMLEQENFAPLQSKRVGLITNQTGVDREGRRTIDVLDHAPGVKLVAIFSPEHGLSGRDEGRVRNTKDRATGLPVYSLYDRTLRPTASMLRGIDALVFDIQTSGARFDTYTTTMAYAMQAAARHHIPFFVLDRPDPLGGERIAGPVLDRGRLSFTGYFPEPVIYGMTIGELAKMYNAENHIGADLTVIPMQNWNRQDAYDQTGLIWIPLSPSLRTLNEVMLNPGVEILQAGGVSVGRGTDRPLDVIGAPYIHGPELADALNHAFIPGVRFVPAVFVPSRGIYQGRRCEGVSLLVTDRGSLSPMLMGIEIAATLGKLYPENFKIGRIIQLLGSRSTLEQLEGRVPPPSIAASWANQIDRFRQIRKKYLIYPGE